MLQFSLDGDDPYEFAGYAPEFAETLEKVLNEGYAFENVNAVVLGVGKTDCGISYVERTNILMLLRVHCCN